MTTKPEILDEALQVLRRGESLTLDSVARAAKLTKPGVVHHFPTKEVLALAVLDHLLDSWEAELDARAGTNASPLARLRAYVEYTLLGAMDPADLALLADPRLRDRLADRWVERMSAWFGEQRDPRIAAVRLIADGAWIDRCTGILDLTIEERTAVLQVAVDLLDEESER